MYLPGKKLKKRKRNGVSEAEKAGDAGISDPGTKQTHCKSNKKGEKAFLKRGALIWILGTGKISGFP